MGKQSVTRETWAVRRALESVLQVRGVPAGDVGSFRLTLRAGEALARVSVPEEGTVVVDIQYRDRGEADRQHSTWKRYQVGSGLLRWTFRPGETWKDGANDCGWELIRSLQGLAFEEPSISQCARELESLGLTF